MSSTNQNDPIYAWSRGISDRPRQELVTHLVGLDYDNCCEHQNFILNSTVNNPIIQKYPIKKSYQKEFLKLFINKIEKDYLEVSDLVYEALINILPNQNEDVHFRHFLLANRFISLKENTCFISQGTTGLFTWQAGIALANWCLENSNLLKGKHILELGCGSGLTGLAVIFSSISPKSYTFSDCHPLVLENLQYNIRLNFTLNSSSELLHSFPLTIGSSEVKILNIDWENIDQLELQNEDTDLILAADVIYDPNLTQSFCKALSYLIGSSKKQAIVACTERDPITFKKFKELLGLYNLKIIAEIQRTASSEAALFYSSDKPVIICKIQSCILNSV
uniref:FAM86 domain-containing protein n=1 Tax=Rhodnius prolixus TaxID=13249 RepID=T1HAD4_RHOPR